MGEEGALSPSFYISFPCFLTISPTWRSQVKILQISVAQIPMRSVNDTSMHIQVTYKLVSFET